MCAAFWLVKSFVGVLPSTCIPIRQMLLMLRATPVALVHASLPCNTGEPSLPGVCFGVDCRALVDLRLAEKVPRLCLSCLSRAQHYYSTAEQSDPLQAASSRVNPGREMLDATAVRQVSSGRISPDRGQLMA